MRQVQYWRSNSEPPPLSGTSGWEIGNRQKNRLKDVRGGGGGNKVDAKRVKGWRPGQASLMLYDLGEARSGRWGHRLKGREVVCLRLFSPGCLESSPASSPSRPTSLRGFRDQESL